MNHREREMRILGWHCAIGAVVLGGVAGSGVFVPFNLWATFGAGLLGAWFGFAIYRLRNDSLI